MRFRKASKEWEELEISNIKKGEIAGTVRQLKSRDSNLHLHMKEISDFEDDEFYCFRDDFGRKHGKVLTASHIRIGADEFDTLTYVGDTVEWGKRIQIRKNRSEN